MLQQKELFQENGFVLSFKTSFILRDMLLSTQDNYFFLSAAATLGLTVFLLLPGSSASPDFHGFRKKISSIDELKEGDKIAVPNDAINERRALSVLQAAGLIKFDDTGDSVTKSSITENPKKLEIVEVDASQTASLLPDVAAALVNGGYSRDAGLKKSDVIFDDDINAYDPDVIHGYINVIVARTEDKDNELYKEIVKAYQTDRTKQLYQTEFEGIYVPAWE